MAYNPDLGDTHEDYTLAVALGYDRVARAHAGEHVPISDMNLPRDDAFTITDRGVLIRELALGHDGATRHDTHGRPRRRVRLRPLPTPTSPWRTGISGGG